MQQLRRRPADERRRAGRADRARGAGGAGAAAGAAGAGRGRTVAGSASAARCRPGRSGSGSRATGSTASAGCSGDSGRCDAARAATRIAGAPSDPERVLEHALVLDNATFRLLGVEPAWTRYLVLDFRFAALSDEKRDGVLRLAINLATGAMPDAVFEPIAPWLEARRPGSTLPDDADLPPAWERRRVLDLVARRPAVRLDATLAPSSRACGGDWAATRSGCTPTMTICIGRPCAASARCSEDDPERPARGAAGRGDRARISCQDSTISRASMRCGSRSIGCRRWSSMMPVQRFAVQIRRRKAQRVIHLDWNPLARRLESPVCEFSCGAERPRLVCDDAMHLVTPAGLAPCASCGRPFCRACHPERCPKCGHAVQRFSLTQSHLS